MRSSVATTAAAVGTPATGVLSSLPSALSWVATVGACAVLARLSGAEVAALRLLLPYLGWLLLAPAVALFARRWPLERRYLARHAVAAVVATALLQLTFRSLHWLFTGIVELPPLHPGYAFTVLWITLLMYVSAAGTVTAIARLAAAHRRQVEAVRSEAEALSVEAERTLSKLGPHALDALIGRVRRLAEVADTKARRDAAEAAIDALGRYLRLGIEGLEGVRWTLRSELALAGAFLEFENAFRRDPATLAHAVDPLRLEEPVRQHSLIEGLGPWLRDGGPLALEVRPAAAGFAVVRAGGVP